MARSDTCIVKFVAVCFITMQTSPQSYPLHVHRTILQAAFSMPVLVVCRNASTDAPLMVGTWPVAGDAGGVRELAERAAATAEQPVAQRAGRRRRPGVAAAGEARTPAVHAERCAAEHVSPTRTGAHLLPEDGTAQRVVGGIMPTSCLNGAILKPSILKSSYCRRNGSAT